MLAYAATTAEGVLLSVPDLQRLTTGVDLADGDVYNSGGARKAFAGIT